VFEVTNNIVSEDIKYHSGFSVRDITFDMIEYISNAHLRFIFKVRTLRGLGAIQPGVNRCKLITRRDFEALYQDCTTSR
jgi:hypothetical protein